jgi:hypothetical protein
MHNRHHTHPWIKFFILSAVFHGLILFILFFVYQDAHLDLTLIMRAAHLNQPVVIVQNQQSLPVLKKDGAKKGAVIAAPAIAKKEKSIKKSATSLASLKAEKAATVVAKEKKKVVKKTVVAKKTAKKGQEKSVKKEKVVAQIKKEIPLKKVVEKKISPPLQSISQAPPIETAQKIEPVPVPVISQAHTPAIQDDPSLATLIDSAATDEQAMMRYAELQEEFARCWKPPIGMAPDCVCQVTLFINKKGEKENIAVQSSGVFMYDVAVRAAIHTMQLPRWAHNKSLTIVFRP